MYLAPVNPDPYLDRWLDSLPTQENLRRRDREDREAKIAEQNIEINRLTIEEAQRAQEQAQQFEAFNADATRFLSGMDILKPGARGEYSNFLLQEINKYPGIASTLMSRKGELIEAFDTDRAKAAELKMFREAAGVEQLLKVSRMNAQDPYERRAAEQALGEKVDGMKKIRFVGTDDHLTDFGVTVIDAYAPGTRTAAGATLASALSS